MKNVALLWSVIGGLAVLLGVAVVRHFTGQPPPLLSAGTVALVDSLKRTHAADSAKIDQMVHQSATLTRAADSAVARARGIEARTAAPRRAAATLADLARAVDSVAIPDSSARLWHQAYDIETAIVDSLMRAIALRDDADANRLIARSVDTSAIVDLRARLGRSETLNADLKAAVDRANKRGKLFGFIPEPTRVQTAVVFFVAGVALGIKHP